MDVLLSTRFTMTNYVSQFCHDCRGRFLKSQNICHGVHSYHGQLRLPIQLPCVASRLSCFDHGGLKHGCRDRRQHSVNATLYSWSTIKIIIMIRMVSYPSHTVPSQASQRQITSIKCTLVSPQTDIFPT